MSGKKVIFTSWTRQKNNRSETGQNNLFWDNLFGTCQPSDWLKYPGDPGKLICSRVHSARITQIGLLLGLKTKAQAHFSVRTPYKSRCVAWQDTSSQRIHSITRISDGRDVTLNRRLLPNTRWTEWGHFSQPKPWEQDHPITVCLF